MIFRDWSDAEEPVAPEYVERVVALWEWRISELGKSPHSPSAIEEAKELGWLFHTPYIPEADLIRLGQATAHLARGKLEMYSRWERMLTLAQADPDGAFRIVEAVLLAELRAEFVHVPVDDARPVLGHVLAAGNPDTQQRARRLINKLGERGFRQLKDLVDD
jgi:hypothetical protein